MFRISGLEEFDKVLCNFINKPMMSTFGEKVIAFYRDLEFKGKLPPGISIMNPFRESPRILPVVSAFNSKFYNDTNERHIILGINPGRFGAGVTGLPFTDTVRLQEKCGLAIEGIATFETSSVFIYEMIDAFGGPGKFYSKFYISAISPLGFTAVGKKGNAVNYNYYDSRKLSEAVYGFILETLEKQLEFGIKRDICFCLGTGQNYKFLFELNEEKKYFGKIVPLEHPRYIMQYKTKKKNEYIGKYLEEFSRAVNNRPEV
jgi:hypothetical protein